MEKEVITKEIKELTLKAINAMKEFMGKYVFAKPEEKEELTPQQFLISIFGAVMFFVCLTVLKLPYDAENATLLNCYYLSLLAFAVICYAYNEFKDDKSKQLHIRRIFIIITIIVCCLGLYLYVSHLDYIDAHISEWGSFNKVSR